MKKFLFLALLCLSSTARAEQISLTTEEYEPFSYRQGDKLVGVSVEQVEAMLADAHLPYKIEMMPWVRAIDMAENTPLTCVFTTAHNAERNTKFKWVEPLLLDRNILIAMEGSKVTAVNLDEAKQYVVGTQRGDYTETILREKNFPMLDVATDFKLTLRKLISGRIDLMPISELYFEKLRNDGTKIRKIAVLSEQSLGIACQKDFPDSVIKKMQAALDALITDGRQAAIYQKYGLKVAP